MGLTLLLSTQRAIAESAAQCIRNQIVSGAVSSAQTSLVRAGFDPDIARRIERYSPELIPVLSTQTRPPATYYRGMMLPAELYSPKAGAIYVTPNLAVASRYAAGGVFDPKYVGRYKSYVFEFQFPPGLMKAGTHGNKEATIPTFTISDERAFIQRVGIRNSETSEIRWHHYSEAFDEHGTLRSDL